MAYLALAAVVASIAASDLVVLSSGLRMLLYAIPLGGLVLLTQTRVHWLLKASLTGYALLALGNVIGASRELANVLSLIPATLLAAYAIQVATSRTNEQQQQQ